MSNQIITKPEVGSIITAEPMIGETASLNFSLEDIHNFRMTSEGLEIKMDDGAIVMITNFDAMAKSSMASSLVLSDGTTIDPATLMSALEGGVSAPSETYTNMPIVISQPDMNVTREIKMEAGQKFQFDFDPYQATNVEMLDGEVIISFETNGMLILRGFEDVAPGQLPPEMTLADGSVVDANGLITTVQMAMAEKEGSTNDGATQYANDDISPEALEQMLAIQPAAGEEMMDETSSFPFQEITESADLETMRAEGLAVDNEHQSRDAAEMAQQAQELAQIETAAGGNGSGSSRGGFGFSSQVDEIRVGPLDAVGPIDPTQLQYKAPDFNDEQLIPEDDQPTGPNTPGAEFEDLFVKEDSSVNMLFNVVGNSTASVETTVVISNIPTGWDITSTEGTFDAAAGTWTYTMNGDETFSGILTFTPPAETDVDLTGADITITNFDPATGLSSQFNGNLNIDVDAVADAPSIDALNSVGNEGDELEVDIAGLLGTDNFDGSEEITSFTIENVPTVLQFSNGNFTINAGGTTANWTFTQAELINLRVSHTDVNFVGSITLAATVNTEEANLSGNEFDTSDNTNSATDEFTLTWLPVVNPPEVDATVNAPDSVIDEDTSVTVDINANLDPNGSGNEVLTVTVEGLDPSWNIVPPTGGSFNVTGTTWTITLPANTNFAGQFSFTPPAESDVDLTGMSVTASAFEPSTSTTAESSDNFEIIVDAVADEPEVDAANNSGNEGETLDIDVTGQLGTDNFDGSESITGYRISGVPTGFTLSAGTQTVPGVYDLTPAELIGLTITPPADYVGTIVLGAEIFTAETNTSDVEPDLTDNTNFDADEFTLTWKPVVNPPEVDATVNAPDSVIDEDTSVTVDINANLDPNGSGNEVLTVTVEGLDPSWNIVPPTGGSFNVTGTTWTITLPANTNFAGQFSFTPPAESDVDLTGMSVTASAFEPSTSTTAESSDNFEIIVDAVADTPSIDTEDDSGSEGETLDIDFQGLLGTDNFDGSESITGYQISGIPAGFTIGGTVTSLGGGVYAVDPANIADLTLTPNDNSYNGSVTLSVTVLTAETNTSDVEPDLTDNTNSATEELTLTWTVDAEPPELEAGHYCIYEDGQEYDGVGTPTGVTFDISASLPASATTAAYLTIVMANIDTAWALTDIAGGTYDDVNGVWSITLPAGSDFTGGPSFFPPADSDVDMNGIIVTATTTEPTSGATATATDDTHVLVDAVADTPDVAANDASGIEEQWIDLDVSAALNDLDGTETLAVEISGMPVEAELNFGTDLGAGIWSIPVANLADLQLRTAPGYEGSFDLTVTAIATESNKTENPDTDFHFLNDVAENSVTFKVSVEGDDTPTIIKPEKKIVDDTNLEFGNDVVSGQLDANFYGDAPGTYATTNAFTYGGSVQNGTLTSGNTAVNVTATATGYVGTAAGETVFTLDLNANTGDYTFTLINPLDHADINDHNDYMYLYFGVQAIDSDGDAADTIITIKVRDDGLTAEDDTANVDAAMGTANGNVIDNDDLSQDTPNNVTKITFGTTQHDVPATGSVTIDGDYGQLEIAADGTYEYTLFGTPGTIGSTSQTAEFSPVSSDASGQQTSISKDGITISIANSGNYDISWLDTSDGSGLGIDNLDYVDSLKIWPQGEAFNIDLDKDASNLVITISEIGSNSNYGEHGVELDITLANGDVVTKEFLLDPALINDGHFTLEIDAAEFGGQLIASAKLYSVNDGQHKGASLLLNNVQATYPGECGCDRDQFEYTLTDEDGDFDTATITFDCVKSIIIVGKNVNDVDPSTEEYVVGEGEGTITGLAGADILVGDAGGSESVPQIQDYNFAFIVDVSGSMGSKDDASTRMAKLIAAVKQQVTSYKEYVDNGHGEVNVSIVPFASTSTQSFSVNIADPSAFDNLITYIESLNGSGYTNYEAGLQNAIDVIGNLPANVSAELVTYFITDGEPNYYLDDAGNVVVNDSANNSMNQILGIDGTDEIQQIQDLSSEVIGVGISVGDTALERISRIDSDGNPLNIQNADDLASALQAVDPISNFDATGSDEINGNAGDDIIFGDVLYTDALATQHGLTTEDGAGWEVFEKLESGESAVNTGWGRDDTIAYIQNNAEQLGQESIGNFGETRNGGDDIITGGAGNDVIFGQEGDDVISGGAGNDNLYGGSGADIFLFDTANDGVDTIADFDTAEGDVLKLDGILENFDELTDAITDFVFATEVSGNTVISIDANGSGDVSNATELATLQGQTGISIADLFNNDHLEVA